MKFTVLYNAFIAEHTRKQIAFGWTSESGWKAELTGKDSDYKLVFSTDGQMHNQVETPIVASIELNEPPKSINVSDDHGNFQVQVYGVPEVGNGENEPGAWVKSE